MAIKVYIDRYDGDEGHVGVMSVRDSEGHFLFEKLPLRSGQKGYGSTHWTPSRSPIPHSDQTKHGTLWLHPQYINYNGAKHPISTRKDGIGWFVPIGGTPQDPWVIEGKDGERTFIGIHPENAFKGSAGCPVLVHDTTERRAAATAFMHWLSELGKLKHPPIEVWVG